ncbi:hypothetical protein HOH87_00610 [bacterium]|nr:hypothetical protein [bacterium]
MLRIFLLSIGYRSYRSFLKGLSYIVQGVNRQPRDLETVIGWGASQIAGIQKTPFVAPLFRFSMPSKDVYSLFHLRFGTPITFAAFESKTPMLEMWLSMGIGGGIIKTMMAEPQEGNARPRIQEVRLADEDCLINAMGLPGPGMSAMLSAVDEANLKRFNRPIGVSLGGHSISEYRAAWDQFLLSKMAQETSRTFVELNISCPNTEDGQSLIDNPYLLAELLKDLRSQSDVVLGIKLSPDQSHESVMTFVEIARSISSCYINVGNTVSKQCADVGLASDAISIGKGGLSGPVLFSRTLERVQALQGCGVPLIATGGVDSLDKVVACLGAGASLVGMATALVINPTCIPKINAGLKRIHSAEL